MTKTTLVLSGLLFSAVLPGRAALVQYWQFEGDTTASAGNSGTVTGSGVSYVNDGKYGRAVQLNNTYIESSLAGTGATYGSATVNFWERTQSSAWRNWTAVSSTGSASGEVRAETNAGDGSVDLYGLVNFADPATKVAWKVGGGNTGATWQMISLVFDGASQTLKVYTNGALDGTLTGWNNVSGLTALRVNSSWNYISGIVADYDDYAVFNTALSGADIASLYSGASPVVLGAVPEPSVYGLAGAGALAVVALTRRRRKRAS